jgi:hypothetical protein
MSKCYLHLQGRNEYGFGLIKGCVKNRIKWGGGVSIKFDPGIGEYHKFLTNKMHTFLHDTTSFYNTINPTCFGSLMEPSSGSKP